MDGALAVLVEHQPLEGRQALDRRALAAQAGDVEAVDVGGGEDLAELALDEIARVGPERHALQAVLDESRSEAEEIGAGPRGDEGAVG